MSADPSALHLGPIAHAHLAGVMAVQALAYGDALLESPEVLGSKLRMPGDTCWGAFAGAGGSLAAGATSGGALHVGAVGEGAGPHAHLHQGAADTLNLCAYAIAHTVPDGAPLVLNKPATPATPQPGDWLYVHDIAVDPAWAGHGLAARLLAEVLDAGRRLSLSRAMLVAVQGADAYWARHGFVAQAAPMAVLGFGEGAVWMVRDL
ncbi:GNAT family N-acetyltransferase [Ottowia sp. GY511]|uniref:GNAT family N-acetyltransferase n=1 Tax=Ottowia flava TaxID=2675430 RepID=A0ABW4KSG8_9BURK|nr:GNAT family N-acetyltransferase [Ottowia sp. GY511]TXK29562.1 GNAT family N-acetyltransferase [Ottowia sp. GY511]